MHPLCADTGGRHSTRSARLGLALHTSMFVTTIAAVAVSAAGLWRPVGAAALLAVAAAANLLIALTYGLVGVLIGPIFGRVAGVLPAVAGSGRTHQS